jgi:hypothetical protein
MAGQDDLTFQGGVLLYRRIPPDGDHVTWDDSGTPTPSSQNFKDRTNRLSVNYAKETTPERVLAGHEGFGLVQFTAQEVRSAFGAAVIIHRHETDPAEGHLVVCGNITNAMARRLKGAAKWVEGGWPINFSAFPFDAAWLTADILVLAQAIRDARDFSRLPSLADALSQLGCTNQAVLSHCRQPGPHSHNCWVVDLILHRG